MALVSWRSFLVRAGEAHLLGLSMGVIMGQKLQDWM